MNVNEMHQAVHGGITRGGGELHVLVVALDATSPLDVGDAEVLVVAPALNSRLRHWFSDDGAARRNAEERAAACVDRLERAGVRAQSRIGDADPLQAIADALPTFAADEIVIAAHPEGPHALADRLASRARERFALPILAAEEAFPHAA
jgi:nucleotide-binding universal stress UspA family protein